MPKADDETVSVIMIVKDGARFIGEALTSIFHAECKPLEILVVDGGSTDATVEIAAAFASVRVIPQKSAGISNAYNEGIAAARGSILAFLSADDIWLPGKLDRQLAAFTADPQLSLSVVLVGHFLEPGTDMPPGFRPELLQAPRPGMLMEALAVRRQAFEIIGKFDPEFSTAEDTDWFARAIDAGLKISTLPELLVRKRIHGKNASLTDPLGHKNRLSALRASIGRKRAASLQQ